MKYTFILPAYKARFFRQAIDSILSQTYGDFKLIIVNDASPEDLDSIVNSYSDSRIRYYKNKENIGGKNLVQQWNYCLGLTNSDYIILASDDDIYDIEYLSKMNQLVDKYPEVNVFRPRIQIIDSYNNVTRVEGYMIEKVSTLEFIYLLQRHYISGGVPFYIFKKEALMRIGGFYDFPMAWGSDDATAIKLSDNVGVVSSSEILFSFRMSGENITSKSNNYQALRNKISARDLYYKFLQDQLATIYISSRLDEVYLNYLMTTLNQAISQSIYELICVSKLDAVIKCYTYVRSLPYITKRWLITICIQRVWQSFVCRFI